MTVSADALAPNGARPSAGTVMTINFLYEFSKFLLFYHFWYIYRRHVKWPMQSYEIPQHFQVLNWLRLPVPLGLATDKTVKNCLLGCNRQHPRAMGSANHIRLSTQQGYGPDSTPNGLTIHLMRRQSLLGIFRHDDTVAHCGAQIKSGLLRRSWCCSCNSDCYVGS